MKTTAEELEELVKEFKKIEKFLCDEVDRAIKFFCRVIKKLYP